MRPNFEITAIGVAAPKSKVLRQNAGEESGVKVFSFSAV
jgi:hypothetical protein